MVNRAKQLEAFQKKVAELLEEGQAIHDELEEALENMPEGIRYNSERGQQAEDRLEIVAGWVDALEDISEEVI